MKLIMKFIVFIVLLAQVTFAQEEAKTYSNILGGGFSFSINNNAPVLLGDYYYPGDFVGSSNVQDRKYTRFTFSPYYAREIKSNLIVGGGLYFAHRTTEQKVFFPLGSTMLVDGVSTSRQIGVEIFSRHSLLPSEKFNFYVQPYIGYTTSKNDYTRDDVLQQERESHAFRVGVGAGLLYNISPRWRALVRLGSISYNKGSWKSLTTEENNDFSTLGSRFSLNSISYGLEMRF